MVLDAAAVRKKAADIETGRILMSESRVCRPRRTLLAQFQELKFTRQLAVSHTTLYHKHMLDYTQWPLPTPHL
jgi:hypothetical protein